MHNLVEFDSSLTVSRSWVSYNTYSDMNSDHLAESGLYIEQQEGIRLPQRCHSMHLIATRVTWITSSATTPSHTEVEMRAHNNIRTVIFTECSEHTLPECRLNSGDMSCSS